MNHKELFEKMNKMIAAGDKSRAKYLEYVSTVAEYRAAVDELSVFLRDYINMPHIQVEDFEIDG